MSDTLICEICGAEVDNWLDDLDEHLAEHDSNYMSYKEENEDTDAYILGFFASKGGEICGNAAGQTVTTPQEGRVESGKEGRAV